MAGRPPARLKGFLEQVFRYGFAIPRPGEGSPLSGLLAGRTARLIVTMGMPGPVYRWMFGAFGVRAIERSVLWLSGLRRIRRILIGGVGGEGFSLTPWLDRVRALGAGGG